jgi:hypothetical protein
MTRSRKSEPQTGLEPAAETIKQVRERIYLAANPALRKELDWFQNWFDRGFRDSIKTRWELAQRIKANYDDVIGNRGRRYGLHAVEMIRKYFGWDEGTIFSSIRLASLFDQEEIDVLCELRMPDGQPLSFTYMHPLSAIPRAKRKKMIQKAVAENWTSRDFDRYVFYDELPAKRGKGGRGRPIGKTKTFDEVVAQIDAFIEDFMDRAWRVWETEEHSPRGQATKLADKDITPKRAENVKRVAGRLLELAEKAQRIREQLLAVHEQFAKILDEPPIKEV